MGEREQPEYMDAQTEMGKLGSPPSVLHVLAQTEMVKYLRRWKYHPETFEPILHPVPIKVVDINAIRLHDLISKSGDKSVHYFFSSTKYTRLSRPIRLRLMQSGSRWKQQGRMLPITDNGETVAYKTYLVCAALRRGGMSPTSETKELSLTLCTGKNRSSWTMEEIGLVEDVELEKHIIKCGGIPQQYPIICCIRHKSYAPDVSEASETMKRRSRKSKEICRDTGVPPAVTQSFEVPMSAMQMGTLSLNNNIDTPVSAGTEQYRHASENEGSEDSSLIYGRWV